MIVIVFVLIVWVVLINMSDAGFGEEASEDYGKYPYNGFATYSEYMAAREQEFKRWEGH